MAFARSPVLGFYPNPSPNEEVHMATASKKTVSRQTTGKKTAPQKTADNKVVSKKNRSEENRGKKICRQKENGEAART